MAHPPTLPSGAPFARPHPLSTRYNRPAEWIGDDDWRDGRPVELSDGTLWAAPSASEAKTLLDALTGSKAGNPDRTMLRNWMRSHYPDLNLLGYKIWPGEYDPHPADALAFCQRLVADCPYLEPAGKAAPKDGILITKPTTSGLLSHMQVEGMVALIHALLLDGPGRYSKGGATAAALGRLATATSLPAGQGVASGASKTGYRPLLHEIDADPPAFRSELKRVIGWCQYRIDLGAWADHSTATTTEGATTMAKSLLSGAVYLARRIIQIEINAGNLPAGKNILTELERTGAERPAHRVAEAITAFINNTADPSVYHTGDLTEVQSGIFAALTALPAETIGIDADTFSDGLEAISSVAVRSLLAKTLDAYSPGDLHRTLFGSLDDAAGEEDDAAADIDEAAIEDEATALALPSIADIDTAIAGLSGAWLGHPVSEESRNMINSIMKVALGDDAPAFDGLQKGTGLLIKAARSLRDEAIAALEAAHRRSPVMAIPATEATPGAPPAEVVWRPAYSMFGMKKGTAEAKAFSFEVPCIPEWRDGKGPGVPKIIPNYILRRKYLMPALMCLVDGKNLMLTGHTGTGKSTLVAQIDAHLGLPHHRLNLDKNIERAEFVGKVDLINDGGTTVTRFVEGMLPRALRGAGHLCLDEIDFGHPNILYVLQRPLEREGLVLLEDGGRTIDQHPASFIAGTMNTRGMGDEWGCYSGAQIISNALRDRFHRWVSIDYLSHAEEAKLLRDTVKGLSSKAAEAFAQLGVEVRKAFTQGNLLQTISPRGLQTISADFIFLKGCGYSERDAFDAAVTTGFIEQLSEDTAQTGRELVARITTS